MDAAVEYVDQMTAFVMSLVQTEDSVQVIKGRKFDRVLVNDQVKYFVRKNTRDIFGAKSDAQANPRRQYGTLHTIDQFNWVSLEPLPNTELFIPWWSREESITSTYKKRGRPRKVSPTMLVKGRCQLANAEQVGTIEWNLSASDVDEYAKD